MDIKKIGEFIAKLRKDKNMTQLELAQVLNVSDKTVSKWESGNGLPEASTLVKIADYFRITVDEILRAGLGEKEDESCTEIIMILDKSGSMYPYKHDTIGQFNSFLAEQQKLNKKTNMTIIFFDSTYQVFQRGDIKQIKPLSGEDYIPSGSTALLDAIGFTIDNFIKVGRNLDKVLMFINTDGEENTSREYNKQTIKQKIEYVKQKYNWEIIFLGANFDVDSFGDEISIDKSRRVKYVQDQEGIEKNFESISKLTSEYRATGRIEDNWDQYIKKDEE